MRFLVLTFAAIALLSAGCRNDPYLDAYIDTVNLEKLALEDRLYELEYDYERLLDELRDCQCGAVDRSYIDGERTTVQSRVSNDLGVPSSDAEAIEDAPEDPTPDSIEGGPTIKFGDDMGAGDAGPPAVDSNPMPLDENAAPPPPFDLSPPSTLTPGDLPAPQPESKGGPNIQFDARNSKRAKSIQLDRRYTGPDGDEGSSRPEFLRLVVQPRDAKRQFVPTAGPLVVVVSDADTKEQIARWDVEAVDVAELLNRNSEPRGIDFRVPWPDEAASSKRLKLVTTMKTADGRTLKTGEEIAVPRVAQVDDKWKPRVLQAAAPATSKSQRDAGSAIREVATKPKAIKRASAEGRIKRKLTKPKWSPTR